jgi:hypothetical protein
MTVVAEGKLVRLVRGHPSPELLDRATDLSEVKPSDAAGLLLKDLGITLSPREAARAAEEVGRADEKYRRAHAAPKLEE